jgi:hypothetical protein
MYDSKFTTMAFKSLGMASKLRIIVFLFIVSPLASMFSEPFFEAVFDLLGWDTESWAAPAARGVLMVASFIGSPTLVSLTTYMAVLGAGVWLHWLAGRMDSKRPSKADKFASLSNMIHKVRNELFDGAKDASGAVDFSSRNRQSDLRLKALYAELRPLGLRPPDYDMDTNQAFNIGNYSYLEVLEPFSLTGNLVEAKKEEKLAKDEFKTVIQNLYPRP